LLKESYGFLDKNLRAFGQFGLFGRITASWTARRLFAGSGHLGADHDTRNGNSGSLADICCVFLIT
jgi:hypothetical protein